MTKKKIPTKEKTVRRNVPESLFKITDRYKKEIEKNVKNKECLSDKAVLEIVIKSLNDLDHKEFLKVTMKKIPKKYLKK